MRKLTLITLLAGTLAVPAMAQDTSQADPQHHSGHADHSTQAPAATPATPAVPATPATQGSPAMPATPAEPASPATPSDTPLTDAQQAAFSSWPANVQEYYNSLPPPRQEAFWSLTDEYMATLAAMDEPQRAKAWAEIEKMLQERAAAAQSGESPES